MGVKLKRPFRWIAAITPGLKWLFVQFIWAFPLGLITYGSYLAWEPLAYIAPGLLIWIDINRKN